MRTSVILGVIAICLLGFILFVDRGTVSTGEMEKRQGRVLSHFIRKRVSRVEIQRNNVTTVIERSPDLENDIDLGQWELKQPIAAAADQDAVDTLMGELEWMDARRRIEGFDESDRKRFGLDAPRYRIWFTVGKERIRVLVGSNTAQGDAVYLQVGDENVAHIVGKDLLEALDQEPGHYHTKELHDGVTIYTLQRYVLSGSAGHLSIERMDEALWLREPIEGLASEPRLRESIEALDALRARRHVAASAGDLSKYGLDSPYLELRIDKTQFKREAKQGEKRSELVQLRFRVGAPCAEREDERYFVAGEDGPIMCVLDADLTKIIGEGEAFRERRVLILEDHQIHAMEVTAGGRTLKLTDDQDTWNYEISGGDKPEASGVAAKDSVTGWFQLLRATEATDFLTVGSPVDATIDHPTLQMKVTRGKDKAPYDVVFGAPRGDAVYMLRQSEPGLVSVASGVLDVLQPIAARFRDKKLLEETEGKLESVTVTRGESRQRAVAGTAGDWSLQAPIEAAADRVTLAEIARLVSALEAVAFVADGPSSHHGLDTPFATVEARYASDRVHRLRIGAEAPGGRFASLNDDPTVLIVGHVLIDQLQEPLVQRALSVPLDQITALRIEAQGAITALRSEDDGFVFADPSRGDAAAAERRAGLVAALRASAVTGYLQAPPVAPADARRIVLEGHHDILVGERLESPAGPRYRVWRTDLAVGFEAPAQAIDAVFEGLRPPQP